MELCIGIIALLLVGRQVGLTEVGTALAPAGSCLALQRRWVFPAAVVCLLAGILLAPEGARQGGIDLLTIAIGTTAATLLGRLLSPHVPVVYAFAGAEIGHRLLSTGASSLTAHQPMAWAVSLVMAALLAGIFCRVISGIVARTQTHYIRLAEELGIAGTILSALLLLAVGFNLGPLLKLGTEASLLWSPLVVLLVALSIRNRIGTRIALSMEREFDLDPSAALSIPAAVLGTLLFFSFDAAASLLGLHATALSPCLLSFAALAGCGAATRRSVMESDAVIRLTGTALATPIVALLVTYLATALFYPAAGEVREVRMGLILAMLIVLVILTAGYALRNYLFSRNSSRMVREQEEQLAENRRVLNRMEVKTMRAENERLHNQLELKRREVMSIALNINEQKEFIEQLYERVKEAQAESSPAEKDRLLEAIRTDLSQRMNFSNEIDSFYTQVEQLHRDFSIRLTEKFPKLTEQERRLTILLRLGFSTKYIATLMNISPKSVEIGRHRLRGKLGLARQQNLANFIKTI